MCECDVAKFGIDGNYTVSGTGSNLGGLGTPGSGFS